MKRVITLLAAVLMLLMLGGCGLGREPKERIVDRVETHYDAIARACEAGDVEMLSAMSGVEKVEVYDRFIIAFCEGHGIATSSQDYGFYYSVDNVPAAISYNQSVLCEGDALTADGDGYSCVVYGDTYYAEHIRGNLWFYSNAT